MRLLFIGDVVGQSGCEFLMRKLPGYKKENGIDVCIANGENSAQGNGVTPFSCKMLYDSGVDFITLGNHCFKRPEVLEYLDSESAIIRPYNFPDGASGKGVGIIDKGRYRIAVINLMGTVYMEPLNNPFSEVDKALEEIDGCKTVIVDFHAEATAEKRSLGFYLDGRVTAVLGTHTHVQTADAQLLPAGTAYITDVGMTGPMQSVLGIEPRLAIKKIKNHIPVRFSNAEGAHSMNGCLLEIDEKSGKALSIKRVVLK
ncbi:MAG: TIGR00282 family metallophosphoesterase [Clostridia bacterium]|jgi:metallophosphoesterase (TIGR00282 family)|nr:TIGR00282 family metallophosphoesterase [Clostridia bacterium]